MGIKQIKVDVNDVVVGMFVSGLDRPWTQSPFPIQGFHVRHIEHIRQLKSCCRHVYIDVMKGSAPLQSLRTLTKRPNGVSRQGELPSSSRPQTAPLKISRDAYAKVTPLRKEIFQARDLHLRVHRALGEIMKTVDADHHNVPLKDTKRLASAMVDSVIRNPDAFGWLSRVRDKDEHTYSHSVRSAIWAILFGRSIGLSKEDLDVLAIGVLLKDIGKIRLARSLLAKSNRNEKEQENYEQFVNYSVAILRKLPDVKPRVISVVKTHCEKVNGSGFPQHLRGDKIPLLGKIAGIVTYYDEITNPRGQRSRPMSPSKAVAKLYDVRDISFQEELVVEFIRAIGLYPTGTLVELSTGEVAVVVEQNLHRRLKPKVMVVLDSYKKPMADPRVIDLAAKEKQRQDLLDAGRAVPDELERLNIVQDLEPDAYNLDSARLCGLYLSKHKAAGLLTSLKNKAAGLPRFFKAG